MVRSFVPDYSHLVIINQSNFICIALFIHACNTKCFTQRENNNNNNNKNIENTISITTPPSPPPYYTRTHTLMLTYTRTHTLITHARETWLDTEDLGSVVFWAIHTGRSRRPCHGGHQRPGPPTLQTIASRAEGTQGQRPPAAVLTQLPAWRTPLRKLELS